MSVIFAEAASKWSEMSMDFMAYIDSAYSQALEATAGVMVNAEGRAKHIDSYILFRSNRAYARKYASEELLEHWASFPRLTMVEYERQWLEGRVDWNPNYN